MKQLLAVLVFTLLGGTSCLFPVTDLSLGAIEGGSGEDGGARDGGPTGGGAGGGFVADPVDGVCNGIALVNPGPPARPLGTTGCYCTRRDAVPVGMCPRGVNQSASVTIGPEGGEISLVGQQGVGVAFNLKFPPGAIATPTLITVTETSLPPPAGSVDFSPVYRIDPVGLVLAEPAALKLPWSQDQICGAPTVFWSATSLCRLEVLPSSYYNAGFNNGNIGRLGYAMTGYYEAGTAPACQ